MANCQHLSAMLATSSLEVGFTTSCIIIAVLTLMHSHLALSLRNSMNNAG